MNFAAIRRKQGRKGIHPPRQVKGNAVTDALLVIARKEEGKLTAKKD